MPLVGIVAKRRDIQAIKKEIREKSIEIVEITKQSIENIKNIKAASISLGLQLLGHEALRKRPSRHLPAF